MNKICLAIFVSVSFLLQSLDIHAFDIGTHRQVSRRAVTFSNLDSFLKTELNFPGGVQDMLQGTLLNMSIIDWVEEGSDREDDGLRPTNHFHNPLSPWDQQAFGFSSIRWGWGQGTANEFTWQIGRVRYFEGLIASTQADREQNLALAFDTLGHLIHLVQDAAVPAHTRDDPHPIFDGFERFVENIRVNDPALFEQLTGISTPFDSSILALSPNPDAPIAIARIIDTFRLAAAGLYLSQGGAGGARSSAQVGSACILCRNLST